MGSLQHLKKRLRYIKFNNLRKIYLPHDFIDKIENIPETLESITIFAYDDIQILDFCYKKDYKDFRFHKETMFRKMLK